MNQIRLNGVEAFSEVCKGGPLVGRAPSRKGVGLYGWNTGPVREVHVPETRELILTVHLDGSRHVRVFTGRGLSRSVSKPGDITLIPHGRPISFRTEGAVDFASLHFPIETVAGRDADSWSRILQQPSCLFALRDEYVVASVRTIMRAMRAPSRDNAAYVAKLLDSLRCHVARLVDESDAEWIELPTLAERGIRAPDFDAVFEHIEHRLAEKLPLEELAERCGVSRAVFAREFRARFDCSPHRYINQRRIAQAKALLVKGSLGLADVAYEVGFSGHSHFSTVFKAFEGCSPATFVNTARRND